jgi:hypothetical protein
MTQQEQQSVQPAFTIQELAEDLTRALARCVLAESGSSSSSSSGGGDGSCT